MFSDRTITTLIAPLLALMVPRAAMAFLAHPASWKQVSADGRYVLVMVSPLSVEKDAGDQGFDAKEIRQIRATYTRSGLYHNDGSTIPIWTLPYHNWTHQVFIAPGGKHLVIADDDWYQNYGHVVSFYSNGNPLASYSMHDLVWAFRLKSLLNGQGLNCGGIEFHEHTLTFTTHTDQGEEFVFDATTGKIIRHSSPYPLYAGAVVVMIVASIIFLVMMLRRNPGPTHASGAPPLPDVT